MTGPQDPAAGGDRLMAGHADLEQVIEALKDALVQCRLTRDELSARAGRALAALTADIPAGAGPARRPAPALRRPLARAAAGSVGCLVIAFAAMRFVEFAEPGGPGAPDPYHSWVLPCVLVAVAAVVAALFIVGYGVGTAIEQRRSRRQLPPRPGPGGHAPDGGQRGSVGHGPVPPGPLFGVTDNADGGSAGDADVVVW